MNVKLTRLEQVLINLLREVTSEASAVLGLTGADREEAEQRLGDMLTNVEAMLAVLDQGEEV